MATRGIAKTLIEKTKRYQENKKTAANATKVSTIPGSLGFAVMPIAQLLTKSITFVHSIFPPVGAALQWFGVFINLVGFLDCLRRKIKEGRFNLAVLGELGDAFLDLFASLGSALLLTAVAILPYILAGALAGTLGPILLIGAAAFTAVISFGRSLWHMTQTLKYLILKDKVQMKEHLGKSLDYFVYTVGAGLMALALTTMMVALPHITLPVFLTFSAAAAVAISLIMCAYSAAKTLYGIATTNIDEQDTSLVPVSEENANNNNPGMVPNLGQCRQLELQLKENVNFISRWVKQGTSYVSASLKTTFSSPTLKPVPQNKRLEIEDSRSHQYKNPTLEVKGMP